ncbi:MAG: cation:dicarboxylase symporter family transporter [Rickettsiaceae bacterium]|nr:MAG: cation:dicarboxylase symporter family transporter [Rickettsiaceae bacterium]
MLGILKHRSFQILLILALYAAFADQIPMKIQQALYATSLLIKELLVWIIPMTVAMYIANTIQSFEKKAPFFIIALVIFEGLSNFSAVWYGYISAIIASKYSHSFAIVDLNNSFTPLWKISSIKPSWWSPDKGAAFGLLLGLSVIYSKNRFTSNFISLGNMIAERILTKFFSRLIPVYVLGFAVQMYQMKLLSHLFTNYGLLINWMLMFLMLYIFTIFLIGARGVIATAITHMKNVMPAGILALTSGCSLSTMPWTIKGAARNLDDPFLAKAIIPTTTNIQQVGDIVINTFLCFLIYKNFNNYMPSPLVWLHFSIVFVAARFAVAAVLGGAMFIMVPIYEAYLGFNSEMIAIILALNVILDPIVTSTNVIGNAALCKVFENVWNKLQAIAERLGKNIKNSNT